MAKARPAVQQPPPVQKLAIQYGKQGPMRFASHRVIQRVFERAIRRANLPVAFSSGFSPHPRLSYLSAAPTGTESQAEYLVMGLSQEMSPDAVRLALGAVMPTGLPLVKVVTWAGGNLASSLEASLWRLEFAGLSQELTDDAGARLMRESEVWIERAPSPGARRPKPAKGRQRETGPDRREVRAAVVDVGRPANGTPRPAHLPEKQRCAILDLTVRHTTPAVRPDDVTAALAQIGGLELESPVRATRLAQGKLRGNARSIDDPLTC